MKIENLKTKSSFAVFLTGATLAVALGLTFALSTSAFALGGGGGGGPAPKVTKVEKPAPVTNPAPAASESKTRKPEEESLAIGGPDEDKTPKKPDDRTTEFPKPGDTAATVGFASASSSVAEGGGHSHRIEVRTNKPIPQPITLAVTTGGTASEGVDYRISSLQLTIPANAERAFLTLTVIDDNNDEVDERVTLALSAPRGGLPANVSFGEPNHSVTIIDDDVGEATVEFRHGPTQIKEGEGADLKVALSNTLSRSVTVQLSKEGDGLDLSSSTVTFQPGQKEKIVRLSAVQDDDSNDERVVIYFGGSLPAGVTRGQARSHVVAIIDDDPVAPATVGFAALSSVLHEGRTANIQVRLSNPLPKALTLSLSLSGTVSAGGDVTFSSNTVTFPQGETSADVDFAVLEDAIPELDETITITLEGNLPQGVSFGTQSHTVTIPANDNAITFSAPSSTSIAEEGGVATVTAAVNQPIPGSVGAVTVTVTPGGSAVRDADYRLSVSGGSLSGDTWTLPAQASNAELIVTAIGNSVDAEDKTLTLDFAAGLLPAGWHIQLPARAAVTIVDDDLADAIVRFEGLTTQMKEGETASLKVLLSRAFSQPVTLTLSEDGNENNIDFSPSTVTFRPGSTVEVVDLTAAEDEDGDDERVTIYLGGNLPAGVRYGEERHGHIVTIVDDDPIVPVTVGFHGATSSEVREGGTTDIEVVLSKPLLQEITLSLQEGTTGTASAGDFTLPRTVTFPQGTVTAAVALTVLDDDVAESDETIVLTLTGESLPADVAIGAKNTHTVTIPANDQQPEFIPATVKFATLISEVNEGDDVELQVELSKALPQTVELGLDFRWHTASRDDVDSFPSTVTFPQGETTASVNFTVKDDAIAEGQENFRVALTIIGEEFRSYVRRAYPRRHIVTIIDGGPVVSATVGFAALSSVLYEGRTANIQVRLSNPLPQEVALSLEGTGTAASENDSVLPRTVTFPQGATTARVGLTILNDDVAEPDETVTLTLTGESLPAGVTIGAKSTHTVTIPANDQHLRATVKFVTSRSTVKEGDDVEVQVELSKPLPQTVELDLELRCWSVSSDDVDSFPSTVTFPQGETTASVNFTVEDDIIPEVRGRIEIALAEREEFFPYVRIGYPNRHTVIVDDNDIGVGFSWHASVVLEGVDFSKAILLTKPLPQPLTLSVVGSAGSGDDIIIPDSVTFEPGETRKYLEIESVEDLIFEGDETFTLSLEGVLPDGVYFRHRTHNITIWDNDDRAVVGFVGSGFSSLDEGNVKTLTVNLSNPILKPVTLDLVKSNQGGGNDIELSSSRLTFQPGETSKTVDVTVVDDEIDEPEERVTIDLKVVNPPDDVTLTLGGRRWGVRFIPRHTMYISTSDPYAPTIEFEDATTRIEEGFRSVAISIRLSPPTSEEIHLNYEYTGSAKRGKKYYEKQYEDSQDADYAIVYSRSIVKDVPSYTDTMTAVTIKVFEDAIDEDDETVTITISGELPGGVKFGRRTHTVTITDDDDGSAGEHVTVGFARPYSDFNEDVGSVAVEVVLSEPLDEPLTVSYSRWPVPRSSRVKRAIDVYLGSNSLTFQPGETSKSFLFDIADDRVFEPWKVESADYTLLGRLPEGVRFGRTKHVLIDNDNETGDGIVESRIDGTHEDGIYVIEYNGENHISLSNDERVAKIEAQHLNAGAPYYSRIANISIENSSTVDTDIVARNHIAASSGLISIKNGATGIVGGNVIGKHHGEGNILIENRGRVGGDIRAVHFRNGDIQIDNHGTVGEDVETTHYGGGDISITNHDYINGVIVRHFGNGVVRYNGDINKRLSIVGNYEGSNDRQLNFHVRSDSDYAQMDVEGNVTGESRVSLIVAENATVNEDTHFEDLIEVAEDYDAEANSFAGEQTIGAFNYVLEHANEYGHAWSFINKGLSEAAKENAKVPEDTKKDIKTPPTTDPDKKKELGLWGGLDSSHTDIGLSFPAFVSNDDYHIGSQVQYYFKEDRTGIRALVETEYNFDVMNFRITPHARLIWTRVGFDDFIGSNRERVSLVDGDTVDLGLGLSFDNEYQISNGLARIYGGANLLSPLDGETSVRISGFTVVNEQDDLSVDGQLGLSYEWSEAYAIRGEVSMLRNDDAEEIRANLGLDIDF